MYSKISEDKPSSELELVAHEGGATDQGGHSLNKLQLGELRDHIKEKVDAYDPKAEAKPNQNSRPLMQ